MMGAEELAVEHTEQDLPRLRSDLKWTLHQFADGPSYTVINPTTGLNFQVGLAEYAFASMLDGRTSIADAAEATRALARRRSRTELAIDDRQGAMVAAWLTKMQLTVVDDPLQLAASSASSSRIQFSPLSIKMPLADPTAVVDALSTYARPLTSPLALLGALVVIVLAVIQVSCDLDRWSDALRPLADPNSWWILGAIALALRVLHEAAHAMVANRLKVRVGKLGILWILLMPLPYVDVSESWQRNRRRERMLIAAAGMLAEMVAAAIAVFVFTWSSSELVTHLAASVAVTASVITMLFNANVLMRFDGYHMLVDAAGIPNLYGDSSAYVHGVVSRIVLGKKTRRITPPVGWLGVCFRLYGLAASMWRVVVLVGLILAAEHLLGGAGVILGIAAAIAVSVKLLRGLPHLLSGTRPPRVLLGVVTLSCVLVAVWYMPLSQGRTETGVVRYCDPHQVRAGSDGFVRELLVGRGQFVRQGEPLVTLKNAELEHEIAMLRIELAAARLKHRRFLAENQMASVEAQWSSIVQLREQLARRDEQLDGLTIRAGADGVVAAPEDLSLWLGRFVREGTDLMHVVRDDDLEIVVLVDQQSRRRWSQQVGGEVKVRRPIDWNRDDATLASVSPRATDQLPHEVLGAHQGGSLAVRPARSGADAVRLLVPRFETRVKPNLETDLRDGQRVLVTLETKGKTVGQLINESAAEWLDTRLARHSVLRQLSSF